MEETLSIATSFFKMAYIQANPHKSFLFTIGEENTSEVKFDNTVIKKTDLPIRYLGVWVEKKPGKKYQRQLIEQTVAALVNKLTWKQITDKQTTYLVNHVIFPKIEYLLNDVVLTENKAEKINKRVRRV